MQFLGTIGSRMAQATNSHSWFFVCIRSAFGICDTSSGLQMQSQRFVGDRLRVGVIPIALASDVAYLEDSTVVLMCVIVGVRG